MCECVYVFVCAERGRERQRERHTHTETDKQTERETESKDIYIYSSGKPLRSAYFTFIKREKYLQYILLNPVFIHIAGLPANKSSDRSYHRGMILNKIHLIRTGCLRHSIALIVQNRGLNHHSSIHSFIHMVLNHNMELILSFCSTLYSFSIFP